MNHYLLMSGIILNTAVIVINRFIYKLPNWLSIPLLLVAVGLILAGMLTSKG